jgi:serine/threonine protein kinase
LLHIAGPRIKPQDIENEARVIRKLCGHGAHTNIVEVLRLGELGGSAYYFIDMELCDKNLEEYIYRQSSTHESVPYFLGNAPSSIKAKQIWNVVRQIASGIAFIHNHEEVHRELKPSNSISPNPLVVDQGQFSGRGKTLHGSWQILGSVRRGPRDKFNSLPIPEEQ